MEKEKFEKIISLLSNKEPKNIKDDSKEIGQKLVDVLKTLNIKCDIKKTTRGATYTSYLCDIEMPQLYQNKLEEIVKGENKNDIFEKLLGYIEEAMKLPERIAINVSSKGNEVEIQIDNNERQIVYLKKGLDTEEFKGSDKYNVYLGEDVNGKQYYSNIIKMPHLLMCGNTGSGKSMETFSIITSLMMKCTPEDAKFLFIDPKQIEYDIFNDSPYSLTQEVIKTQDEWLKALEWVKKESVRRGELFSTYGARDIDEFNEKFTCAEHLPRIFIVIDELADLLYDWNTKDNVINCFGEISRLARCTGIHMIVCTQRPPCIDYNIPVIFPTKIVFRTLDKIDIIKGNPASLTGFGDFLFDSYNLNEPIRLQGPFETNDVYKEITNYLKWNIKSSYDPVIESFIRPNKKGTFTLGQNTLNDDVKDAIRASLDGEWISISILQRALGWGWPRAAKVFDQLVKLGIYSDKDRNMRIKLTISEEEAKALCDKKEIIVKYALSKNMIQAMSLAQIEKDGIINNVKLQLDFGWKSAKALKIIEELGKLSVFKKLDEDTLKVVGSKEEIQKIIDNAVMQ